MYNGAGRCKDIFGEEDGYVVMVITMLGYSKTR